jgi:hypothetical protein
LAFSRIFLSYLNESLAWVCRPEKNLVFIVTATHHLQPKSIWEVLSLTGHRWHLWIKFLENWVFGHNTTVSPSGADIDSFADFSDIALQL